MYKQIYIYWNITLFPTFYMNDSSESLFRLTNYLGSFYISANKRLPHSILQLNSKNIDLR